MSEAPPGPVEERAYAKINLSLDVLGKRADGFHEIRSVMQSISLHDTIHLFLEAEPSQSHVADRDYSLVDRAISATLEFLNRRDGIGYELVKRIPLAAGLGGGSADAAAAIRGTCRLLGVSPRHSDLMDIAATLGSDVPYFLVGATAVVEGRGERVTPRSGASERWFVLANDGTEVSTRAVFEALEMGVRGDAHATDRVVAALEQGQVIFGGNDLERVATRLFPSIQTVLSRLSQVAPEGQVAMSGSGGTMVAIFDDERGAREAHEALAHDLPWVHVAHSVDLRDEGSLTT